MEVPPPLRASATSRRRRRSRSGCGRSAVHRAPLPSLLRPAVEPRDGHEPPTISLPEAVAGGVAVAGSGAEDGAVEVRSHLRLPKLERYAAAMLEHGYDDWGEIVRMTRVKLSKLVRLVTMVENHADRFRNYVAERAARGTSAALSLRENAFGARPADEGAERGATAEPRSTSPSSTVASPLGSPSAVPTPQTSPTSAKRAAGGELCSSRPKRKR